MNEKTNMNEGEKEIERNKIDSYLPSRVVHFLINLHVTPRSIWFTR